MSEPFLQECGECYAVVRPVNMRRHWDWHEDSKYMVVKVGENEWVAADENGWTDGIYATESEAWEAIGAGRMVPVMTEEQSNRLARLWQRDGHDVMFNKNKDDLTPQQRVGKWLQEMYLVEGK